ncbi:MAG: zinc ribbon domain-containing protein [Promethearchaeota archaeon]|nr:MAG: zinc ribbon domain-containing protein [Candidatus Lokiarchaeota archaeon]
MGDIRNYSWAFPIGGGFLAIIALLTPSAYYSDYYQTFNFWMWGLVSYQIYDYYYGSQNIVMFTDVPQTLSLCIICSILIIICIIGILSSGSSYRRKMRSNISDKAKWLAPSILLIIGAIIWMVGMEIISLTTPYPTSFWSTINPGFGVIGMFLGGAVSIIGYGISRMKPQETREIILPMKKEFIKTGEVAISADLTKSFRFCPNCGHQIYKQEQRFCTNCGFEFNGIPMTQYP